MLACYGMFRGSAVSSSENIKGVFVIIEDISHFDAADLNPWYI